MIEKVYFMTLYSEIWGETENLGIMFDIQTVIRDEHPRKSMISLAEEMVKIQGVSIKRTQFQCLILKLYEFL